MAPSNLIALEEEYGARNYRPLDVVLHRGEGVWVWDVSGERYLDCLSAYSAVNQGHCHPTILDAMERQARLLTLTSRAFRNDQLGPFYRELCELTNSHKVLPMNSGAEAVESAIKVVRKWGYEARGIPTDEAEIIVCNHNFHGRTIALVGFSSDPDSFGGFGPFPSGFRAVPFGDADAAARAVSERTVAILAEPIQGEAGVIVPPDGYLRDLRTICDDAGIQLVLDEIQTGLGRTGKLLAEQHEGVEADLTVVGKALSGGFYPISAVLSNTEVMDVLQPGQHGSTFGGNPLAAAIGRAAIRVLVEEGMIENAAAMGARFLAGLRGMALRYPALIREARGRGLLLALEMRPEAGGARRFTEALKTRGLLCKETHDHTIRITPPLVIDAATVDWALDRIDDAILSAT